MIIILSLILFTTVILLILKRAMFNKLPKQERCEKYKEYIRYVFIYVILAVYAFAISISFGIIADLNIKQEREYKTETKIIEEKKLAALTDNINTKGTFFLGIGSINEKMYYYCLVQYPNGLKQERYAAEDIYLNEIEPGEQPRFVRETDVEYVRLKKETPKYIKILTYPFNTKLTQDWSEKSNTFSPIIKKLYIPKGSILQDYKVDMQ